MVLNMSNERPRPDPGVPIVMRGSAPQGTFRIPDDGLRLDSPHSFLSRFQSSLRFGLHPSPAPVLKTTSETPNPLAPKPVTQSETASPSQNVHQPNCFADHQTPNSLNTSFSEIPIQILPSPSRALPSRQSSTHTITDASHIPLTKPNQPARPSLASNHTLPTYSREDISAEQAADDVEDNLIQVNPDLQSLLYPSRVSFPILRFCSATALNAQTALDKLVSSTFLTMVS